MSATVDITLDDLYTAFGNFLQGIIGVDPNTSALVPVVQGQPNRVPMPNVPFMLMQGMVAGRSSTNLHQYNPTIVQPVGKYGTASTMQKTRVKMQVDFYGPQSENWATAVSTLFRDEYGCTVLAAGVNPPLCQPLYSDEPFQGALVNGEEQYEDRWTLVAYVQYNPVTTTAQQFAEALAVTVINVDERYQ
jgi:hypothetical protein